MFIAEQDTEQINGCRYRVPRCHSSWWHFSSSFFRLQSNIVPQLSVWIGFSCHFYSLRVVFGYLYLSALAIQINWMSVVFLFFFFSFWMMPSTPSRVWHLFFHSHSLLLCCPGKLVFGRTFNIYNPIFRTRSVFLFQRVLPRCGWELVSKWSHVSFTWMIYLYLNEYSSSSWQFAYNSRMNSAECPKISFMSMWKNLRQCLKHLKLTRWTSHLCNV